MNMTQGTPSSSSTLISSKTTFLMTVILFLVVSSSSIVKAYDVEFLESGCTLPYDPNTEVDDTVGTYATNFAIPLVCFIVIASVMLVNALKKTNAPAELALEEEEYSSDEMAMSLYDTNNICFFLATGVSFLIAGVGHVIVKTKDDPRKPIIERISYAFYFIASISLFLQGMKMLAVTAPQCTKVPFIWWIVAVVVMLTIGIYGIVTSNIMLIGVFGLVSYMFMIIVLAFQYIQSCWLQQQNNDESTNKSVVMVLENNIEEKEGSFVDNENSNYNRRDKTHSILWKILGFLVMISGNLIQVFLAPVCGDRAYESCFENCPLINPISFNHNALFHLVYMLGLIFLALGRNNS